MVVELRGSRGRRHEGANVSREDDWGQVDGDASGPAQFQPRSAGQPWLRGAVSPWHMWGNTQRLSVPVELLVAGAPKLPGIAGQLVKISYGRPETWRWLLAARLLSGPNNTPTFFSTLFIEFLMSTGIGRSAISLYGTPPYEGQVGPFDIYTVQSGPTFPEFPAQQQIWSTKTLAPIRVLRADTAGQ